MFNKPNFLIVGAAKSGSTSLYQYLNQHPEVFMPVNKEPNYFVAEYQQKMNVKSPNYNRSIKRMVFEKLEYYNLYKDVSSKQKIIGEASVTYLYKYDYAIPKIKEELGEYCKIIIILRNPILRAFSQFSYIKELGFEKLGFLDALKQEKDRLDNNWASTFAYVEQGMFYEQVKAYKNNFKNVHVLLLEDFVKDKNQEMNKIFNFLGIEPLLKGDYSEVFNSSGVPRFKFLRDFLINNGVIKKILRKLIPIEILRKLSLKIRNLNQGDKLEIDKNEKLLLKNIYEQDINKLENLIKRDLNHWLKV
jgi:hypothetical protein